MNNVVSHLPVAVTHRKESSHRIRTILAWAFVLVSLVIFVMMAFTAHTTVFFDYDIPVMRAVQSFNPPWFDTLMRSVNWMGFGLQSVSLISGIILVMFLVGWHWEGFVGAIDAGSVWAINVLIGQIVNRPYVTPDQVPQVFLDLTHPSFPTGHLSSYWAFYGFMTYLVYTRVASPVIRVVLTVLFGALVVLVVPSRIYMGRHWPSDVLASMFLGALWLLGTLTLYRWGLGNAWVRKHLIVRRSILHFARTKS